MRFHVDFDEGSAISLWVVPDNPRAQARIYLFTDHVFRGVLEANDDRRVIREWGWHATGLVAFALTDGNVPGLAAARYVEVYDVDTLVLVYRRAPSDELAEGKFLRYTTGLVPDATVDRLLFDTYRMSYTRVENIPEETLGYIFDYHYTSSVYMSGRISARKIRRFIDKNEIKTCALIDDPFQLLSRHLLWLRSAAVIVDDEARGWRVADLSDAIAFARGLDFTDPKGLRKAIGGLDAKTYELLSNPLTRQFGCNDFGDDVAHQHYVNALDEISHLAVVGHSAHPEVFATSLSGAVGFDVGLFDLPPSPVEEDELALVLRQIKPAQELVGYDMMLAEAVEAVIHEQWMDSADA